MPRRISFADLERRIADNERRGKRPVAVLAPLFHKGNERDGYMQRIKAIDLNALNGFYRIYLWPEARRIQAFRADENHAEVFFNGQHPEQSKKVAALIGRCGCLLVHSVYRLMDAKWNLMPLFAGGDVLKIWDVHGAVPEEVSLCGQERLQAKIEEAEAYAYGHADVIVTLNRAMEAHLQAKHGPVKGRFVRIPYFAPRAHVGKQKASAVEEGEKPGVVYAGGLQQWQNVDMIRDLVAKTHQTYAYHFFVAKPKELRALWRPHLPVQEIRITTLSPQRMGEAYQGRKYGLLFRDDIPVNNVACPAKLIEYMQNGIVPVLTSPRIGDFEALGMRYVSCEAFIQGRIPSEEERLRMAEENRWVLERLEEETNAGCAELKRIGEKRMERQ